MLTNSEDIFKSFLYGIRKSNTRTVKPETFVRIWNEWALRDWMKTHGLFDEVVSLNPIIRDKFRKLIRWVYYEPHVMNSWKFSLPDGSSIEGVIADPGMHETARVSTLPKYVRHLSVQVKLNYSSNTSQECSLTGLSGWLPVKFANTTEIATIRDFYYLKPSDERLFFEIVNYNIHIDNGDNSEPSFILLEYVIYPNHMSYSGGSFSYGIDLQQDQLEEVVDSAVRIHLENLTSPRYQSMLNEDAQRHK